MKIQEKTITIKDFLLLENSSYFSRERTGESTIKTNEYSG
jgi:hypothetical protein